MTTQTKLLTRWRKRGRRLARRVARKTDYGTSGTRGSTWHARYRVLGVRIERATTDYVYSTTMTERVYRYSILVRSYHVSWASYWRIWTEGPEPRVPVFQRAIEPWSKA